MYICVANDLITLNLAQYVQYIPDDVLDTEKKETLRDILIALRLGEDGVIKAITVDEENYNASKMDSELIRAYVNQNISSVENESYLTPEVYQYIAWIGLAVTALTFILMWRRMR